MLVVLNTRVNSLIFQQSIYSIIEIVRLYYT
jgi:hypothetical protein